MGGPPSLVPTPVGGLATRPLRPSSPGAMRPGIDRNDRSRYLRGAATGDGPRYGYRDGYGYGSGYDYGYSYGHGYGSDPRYRVADAPLARPGIVIVPESERRQLATGWFPTVDAPRWRVDSTLVPVQAWRDLIVNDTVCDGYGSCIGREYRVRAPWVAVCRCYMFADALGRRWELPPP